MKKAMIIAFAVVTIFGCKESTDVDASSPETVNSEITIQANVVPVNEIFPVISTKVFEIGSWDMDNYTQRLIPHGLDRKDILYVHVMIHDDIDFSLYMQLGVFDGIIGSVAGSSYISQTDILLQRNHYSFFDGPNWSDKNVNRGYVVIYHK